MVLSDRDREILGTFAHRIDPSDAGAHNNLGALYYMKGMVDEAIEQFGRALELDAKMRVAQQNLELTHKQSGYYDRRRTGLRDNSSMRCVRCRTLAPVTPPRRCRS